MVPWYHSSKCKILCYWIFQKKKFMSTRCVFTIPRIFKTKFITQTRETKKTNSVIYQSLLGMPIVYVKLLGWSRSMGLHSPDNNACWDGQEMGRVWLYLSLSLGILIFSGGDDAKLATVSESTQVFLSCHVMSVRKVIYVGVVFFYGHKMQRSRNTMHLSVQMYLLPKFSCKKVHNIFF
jgi:hypothetical protein